jgi:hypothetical protein
MYAHTRKWRIWRSFRQRIKGIAAPQQNIMLKVVAESQLGLSYLFSQIRNIGHKKAPVTGLFCA